ncbi:MAG TPA: peptidylprolyl isomerase [Fimbriimonas sp.]|nr:peptidylprolyl isomerase [Fimbriimonas sp.]
MKKTLNIAALVLAFGILAGCEEKPAETPTTTTTSSGSAPQESTPASNQYDGNLANSQNDSSAPPAEAGSEVPQGTISVANRKPKDGEEVAVLETEKGKIVLMFFPDKAPKHVANYKKLVKMGFYNGTKFHRTMPGFMIQGGDPNSKGSDRSTWGSGGPDWSVKAEFNDVHHAKGVLSMARSQDPDSAGSQFFIMVADTASLDHQYTAFGKVVKGQEVADAIVALPSEPGSGAAQQPVTLKKATLAKWPVK